MPDLILDEISELKKEEIKLRLLQDYRVISYGNDRPENTGNPGENKSQNQALLNSDP